MTSPADPAVPSAHREGFWRRLLPGGRRTPASADAFLPLFPAARPVAAVPHDPPVDAAVPAAPSDQPIGQVPEMPRPRAVPPNMLPSAAEMTGCGWTALGGTEACVADHPARFEGYAVLSHRLAAATSPDRCAVFGCPLNGTVVSDEVYVVSAWVWIPGAFGGSNVSMSGIGFVSPHVRSAMLERRETWQRIWASVRVPSTATSLFAALKIVGAAGETIFSTAWTVEHGQQPGDIVANRSATIPDRDAAVDPDQILGYRYAKGGLNNQKLALLGLFLAARESETRRLRLPDLHVYDQLSNCRPVVPLASAYSIEHLRSFAARHDIEIVAGAAEGAEGAPGYFWDASHHIIDLQKNGGIRTDDFTCGFFRHLVATRRRGREMRQLANTVFTEHRVGVVAQLRIERDWLRHMGAPRAGRPNQEPEDATPTFEQIIGKISRSLPHTASAIYVVCDEAALPVGKEEIRTIIRRDFGIELCWKSDFVDIATLNVLDLSIMDFEMAVQAPVFVGTSRSSFSNMVSFETFSRRRAPVANHYIYNLPGPTLAARTDNGAFHVARAAVQCG